ncbi:MAG: hypothetical protein KAU02_00250 [Tenericutes bacterium]|nr:hypothetical protein [Mycoplasmatota bacterium]
MKGIFTKKVLVIVSVVTAIVLGAVVLAFATGNTYYPSLSDPDGVFYQRVDSSGNVLYEITNEEIFENVKSNDGVQQLLFLVDSLILEDYIDDVTDEEIAEKLLQLKFLTSDPDELAEISDEDKQELEKSFGQLMILSGFESNPDDYAKLMVAREKFVWDTAIENDEVREIDVVQAYINSYFEDISAIKIRFTSINDADAVLQKYNLLSLLNRGLREYNGYIFIDEEEKDASDTNIAEAYISIDTYYFDEDDNILDLDDEIIYELGANDIYTDTDSEEYHLNVAGDLLDISEVIISNTVIFATKTEAQTHKDNNSEFYTVDRTDPFDMSETIQVLDSTAAVAFTIDPDGHIWDTGSNDVTYTTDLVVNKVFTAIEDVNVPTSNNSTELDDDEVLAKYIEMYNYVYGLYRDSLPVGGTVEDLVALDNEDLLFNYSEESKTKSAVTDYMFKSLSIEHDTRYSIHPVTLQTGSSNSYYLMYKLTEADKEDVSSVLFDSIETTINLPSSIGTSIELPTSSYYDSTIVWTTDDTDIMSITGEVVNPTTDTEVELTYTITCLGDMRTNSITVTVLSEGENSEVVDLSETPLEYKDVVNNLTAYLDLESELFNDYVYGANGQTNINTTLNDTRTDLGFKINDYYIALDYKNIDTSYVFEGNGDKTILASLDKTLDSETAVEITADDLLEYAITKNAALYTVYTSQFKELISSSYYEDVFGTQTNVQRNNSDRMDEMYNQIDQAKQYYTYLQNLYAQYGLSFNYNSFQDYAFSQFDVKTELGLLKYFVAADLQPYLINETNEVEGIVEKLLPTVQENYENYFSLNVSHILTYIDFDEDGNADDFTEYYESLTPAELSVFDALRADLENTLNDYTGTFAELISEYSDATREDETWGRFKQNGFFMMTEDLNIVDKDDNTITHSLNYNGQYGVKGLFVEEYVDALIALYQEYQNPLNVDLDELYSNTVDTQFGLHIIRVTQGDDFDKPTFEFAEEDSANPQFSVGLENSEETPTLEQIELYAQYKFYTLIYDMSQVDVEEKYGIDAPKFPESLSLAFNAYFEDLISSTYVIAVLNVNMAERLGDGQFMTNDYSSKTDQQLKDMLVDVYDIYYDAVFGDYTTE